MASALARLAPPPDYVTPALVVAGSATLALVLAFWGRTRIPRLSLTLLLMACGAGIGFGAGMLEMAAQVGPYAPVSRERELWIAVALLAVLTPFHVRVVLGPLGRKG